MQRWFMRVKIEAYPASEWRHKGASAPAEVLRAVLWAARLAKFGGVHQHIVRVAQQVRRALGRHVQVYHGPVAIPQYLGSILLRHQSILN